MTTKTITLIFNETLPKLYVYAPNIQSVSPTLYLYAQAKEYLKQLFPSTIFSATITDEVFGYFNFFVVDYVIEPFSIEVDSSIDTIDINEFFKYVSKELSSPYYDSNSSSWKVKVSYSVNQQKLDTEWETKRAERNKLLTDTDWIESSDIVSTQTQQKYKLYRQILRDSINFSLYPHMVTFPEAPTIIYTESLRNANNEILSDTQIAYLKDYKPTDKTLSWFQFLMLWKSYNFTNRKQFVANLLNINTDFDLNEILAAMPV
jgi:hypothetical protein